VNNNLFTARNLTSAANAPGSVEVVTATGMLLEVALLLPSWPEELLPQAARVRSEQIA
jgi:hypothetical protein